jgi:uncharacterized protein
MTNQELISKTISFVKKELEHAEGGHDWWHIQRVWSMAKRLALTEKADLFVVELGALLHDIADAKFNDGDETIGIIKAKNFLIENNVAPEVVDHVGKIVEHISFKGGNYNPGFYSLELAVVQDADRLDAIGAIGIARTFNYGGYTNREMYNPEITPALNMTKEEYKKSTAPTINHFYEKLLLLKDRMNTESAKAIAAKRHEFMLKYLEQFFGEWDGRI